MIFDCFMFWNERDILALRIGVLNSVVDKFVVVEATTTHAGVPHTPCLMDCLSTVSPEVKNKIVHVIVEDMPKCDGNRWPLDSFQRNAITRGLKDCKANDLVIISDVDEIPDPEQVKLRKCGGYECQISNYYLNTIEEGGWVGPVMMHVHQILSAGPQYIRDHRFDYQRINPGGWHFTYSGDEQAILKKLGAFTHTEWDTPAGRIAVLEGRKNLTSFVSKKHMRIDDIAKGYYPKYLKENIETFKHLCYPVGD